MVARSSRGSLVDLSQFAPLWTGEELVNLVVLIAAVSGLVVRYRRGDEQRRRQLLWLLLALVLMIVSWCRRSLFTAGPVLGVLSIALVPAAMTIAVLRHQLLDIRLVLSPTVLYSVLTAAVVGVYLALVAAADLGLRREAGLGASVLATLVIALGFTRSGSTSSGCGCSARSTGRSTATGPIRCGCSPAWMSACGRSRTRGCAGRSG